jgi:predicted DNA-binding transcriptional regulator AlpA
MINIEPWTPYFGRTSLSSAGRITLTAAFADVIKIRYEFEAYELPEIFAAPEDDGENDACRDLVQLSAEHTAEQFLRGRILTFARPLVGGEITPLDSSVWEIDDPINRFATGAFNLDRWFDPDAELSHRLFVDSTSFNRWLLLQKPLGQLTARDLESACDPRTRAARSVAFSNDVLISAPELPQNQQSISPLNYCFDDRFDAIDRLEVEKRTSLSRSTIYSYMKKDMFPQCFHLTDNRVVWSAKEIDQWTAERAARRGR